MSRCVCPNAVARRSRRAVKKKKKNGTRCLCAVRDKRSGECFGALAGDEAGGLALYAAS